MESAFQIETSIVLHLISKLYSLLKGNKEYSFEIKCKTLTRKKESYDNKKKH